MPITVKSVFNPCSIRVQSVFNPCSIRVSSVFHPCFIRVSSVFHPWLIFLSFCFSVTAHCRDGIFGTFNDILSIFDPFKSLSPPVDFC